MKKIVIILGGVLILIGLLYVFARSGPNTPTEEGDVVARNGLHWHPTLTIYVDDIKEEIPPNVGLMGGHYPMHTHVEDAGDGVLHFEFSGVVRTNDIRLKNFFNVWGGKDVQTAFGTLSRMTVNGNENTEYGEYIVGEHDAIELFYDSAKANKN